MPVSIRRLVARAAGAIGGGLFELIVYTVPANTRTEFRELIRSGDGDVNTGRFGISEGTFQILLNPFTANNVHEIINRQSLAEETDTLRINVNVANSDPGALWVSGVEYS